MSWFFLALASAFFAALTAILAKIGVEKVDSNVATAVRTAVVLVFAWGIVAGQGHLGDVAHIPRRTMVYLGLSGLATGASWLFYFAALKLGEASKVAPIDKMSLALTLLLSVVVLREPLGVYKALGVALIIGGALLTTLSK
ncbi:MAG TPA: EamA family transporter [Armatimonadota bacterium]